MDSVEQVMKGLTSGDLDRVASEMDPYICKLLDKKFTGNHLRNAIEFESNVRSVAVTAIDTYHGFTCEFSPWPKQHAGEYDTLEELLEVRARLLSSGEAAFNDGTCDGTAALSSPDSKGMTK